MVGGAWRFEQVDCPSSGDLEFNLNYNLECIQNDAYCIRIWLLLNLFDMISKDDVLLPMRFLQHRLNYLLNWEGVCLPLFSSSKLIWFVYDMIQHIYNSGWHQYCKDNYDQLILIINFIHQYIIAVNQGGYQAHYIGCQENNCL